MIRATYHLLGLRTYFTAGEKEVRAWTSHAVDTAPQAAGVIHSDYERGVISAVTRSGTNQWHGSAFEFVRSSAFDAKNFFDPATQKIPHFARNQFGGLMSGPLNRDRTFFLASYEGLRQRLGITNQATDFLMNR